MFPPNLKSYQDDIMYWATQHAERAAIRLQTRTALQSVVPNAEVPTPPKPRYDHMASWVQLDDEIKTALPKSSWQVHGVAGLGRRSKLARRSHAHPLHRSRYDLTMRKERKRTLDEKRKTLIETPYDAVAFFDDDERCDSVVGLVVGLVDVKDDDNDVVDASFDMPPTGHEGNTTVRHVDHGNEAQDITKTQLDLAEWRKSALLDIFGYSR